MKKLIPMAAAMALTACVKELPPKDSTPTDETPRTSSNFVYNNITYLFDEECGQEYIWQEAPPLIFNNRSSVEQTYTYHSWEHTFNRSSFLSYDELAFRFVGENQKVPVPRHISDTNIECDYGTTWSYVEGEQRSEPNVRSMSEICVPPRSTMVLNVTYRYRSLTARYLLTLRGVEMGDWIAVNGRWSGLFLEHIDTNVKIEPLY